jgi:hypothetical protein
MTRRNGHGAESILVHEFAHNVMNIGFDAEMKVHPGTRLAARSQMSSTARLICCCEWLRTAWLAVCSFEKLRALCIAAHHRSLFCAPVLPA